MTTKAKTKSIPLVVTTAHRGVFFGYADPTSATKEKFTLANARNCVYWSADVRGFMGLAVHGPTSNCKITASVVELDLFEITAVLKCSKEAAEKWESAPWS